MNGTDPTIRVLVAADVRFYRDGLAQRLACEENVVVIGTAAQNEETVAAARELLPDVVLLDVAMPDTLSTVRTLCRMVPSVRVVGIAIPEIDEDVIACAEAGMHGYVPRESTFENLTATVRSVAKGELLCSPRIAATLRRRVVALAADRATDSPVGQLTARERETLQLIDRGLSNKEIAVALGIEVSTVKNHVHHILDKLNVRRRGEAAARARTRLPNRTVLRTPGS